MRSASFVAKTVASAGSGGSVGISRSKIVIEKISARIFCPLPCAQQQQQIVTNNVALIEDGIHKPPKSGGNPVTIFKILSVPPLSRTSSTVSKQAILDEECSKLAASCAWESVFIFPPSNEMSSEGMTTPVLPQINIAFYLPTGKPVSFCAHAAMGGAYAYFHTNINNPNNNKNDDGRSSVTDAILSKEIQLNVLDIDDEDMNKIEQQNAEHISPATIDDPQTTYVAAYHHDTTDPDNKGGSIALKVQNIVWQQEPIEQMTTLHRILREYHKVNGSTDCTLPLIEVLPTQQQWKDQDLDQYEPQILKSKYNKVIPLPTFLNSWVGDRKKTMVYINKEETLHNRILPPPSRAAEKHYPAACDSLQNTTGLYLFATKTTEKDKLADQREIKLDYPVLDPNKEDENVWECRQFPRKSGYAEDPATGVAAAALAISLRFCEVETQRIVGYDTSDDTNEDEKRVAKLSSVPSSKYEFYQGTAMQQPSYIVVDNIQVHSLVTQEEEHLPSVAQEELSVFKYAKTVDDEDRNENDKRTQSVIAENINIAASKKELIDMDDDEALEREAANADLFKDVDDDEIWEDDDDDDDDVENDPHSDAVVASPPSSPPKKDFRYHKHRGIVSFTLTGRIEVDAIEVIEI